MPTKADTVTRLTNWDRKHVFPYHYFCSYFKVNGPNLFHYLLILSGPGGSF